MKKLLFFGQLCQQTFVNIILQTIPLYLCTWKATALSWNLFIKNEIILLPQWKALCKLTRGHQLCWHPFPLIERFYLHGFAKYTLYSTNTFVIFVPISNSSREDCKTTFGFLMLEHVHATILHNTKYMVWYCRCFRFQLIRLH